MVEQISQTKHSVVEYFYQTKRSMAEQFSQRYVVYIGRQDYTVVHFHARQTTPPRLFILHHCGDNACKTCMGYMDLMIISTLIFSNIGLNLLYEIIICVQDHRKQKLNEAKYMQLELKSFYTHWYSTSLIKQAGRKMKSSSCLCKASDRSWAATFKNEQNTVYLRGTEMSNAYSM